MKLKKINKNIYLLSSLGLLISSLNYYNTFASILNKSNILEEKVTKTVKTENDFVNIEETEDGHFNDIKIEGKTLTTVFTCSVNEIYDKWKKVDCKNYKPVEVGKTYTIIGELNGDVHCGLKNYSEDYLFPLNQSSAKYVN